MDMWVGGHHRELISSGGSHRVEGYIVFPARNTFSAKSSLPTPELKQEVFFATPASTSHHYEEEMILESGTSGVTAVQPSIVALFIREIADKHDEVGKLSGSLPIRPQ